MPGTAVQPGIPRGDSRRPRVSVYAYGVRNSRRSGHRMLALVAA